MTRRIDLTGSATGWGSGAWAGEHSPHVLLAYDLVGRLQRAGIAARWRAMVETRSRLPRDRRPARAAAWPVVREHAERLAATVAGAVAEGAVPVTLGGDHSCTIGHHAGLARGLLAAAAEGLLGIVWLDAYPDLNTPETSPSGAVHGMGLAAVLGHGDAALAALAGTPTAAVPERLCLVGTRALDPGDRAFVDRHAVRMIPAHEVREKGLAWAVHEAVATAAGGGTVRYSLSIDLDVFDPAEVPSVAFREPYGLAVAEALEALAGLGRDPHLGGVEIVEFEPEMDEASRTVTVVERLPLAMFAP